MIAEIVTGIIDTLSDVALSLLTPIFHVPAYLVGSLVNAGLSSFVPLIDAVNYVGSSMHALLHAIVMLLIWLPPWLYVPIAAILIIRAVMAVVAIATKIVDTMLLRGWI